MKRILIFAAILLAFTGCRREDIRTLTVSLPGLQAAETNKVAAALAPYGGVRKDSFRWDLAQGALTLDYDSMQIAGTNIRMAIEAAGVKVEYPTNTTGRAGY